MRSKRINCIGAEPAVVISYGLWQRRFGGDPSVLRHALTLDGDSCTVVGGTAKECVVVEC